jgi:transcriptional regulator with XRE-family HTH domain
MNTKPISLQHQKQLNAIGLYLKNIRLDERMTQLEVGEQINLHYNTIQRTESGANTTLITIFELADFYGIKPSELLSIID